MSLRKCLVFVQLRYSGAYDYYNFTTGAVHTCYAPSVQVQTHANESQSSADYGIPAI